MGSEMGGCNASGVVLALFGGTGSPRSLAPAQEVYCSGGIGRHGIGALFVERCASVAGGGAAARTSPVTIAHAIVLE